MSVPAYKVDTQLSCEEALEAAIHFIDLARFELKRAPSSIKQMALGVREEVETFKLNLRDEMWQAFDEEGDWCSECPYCKCDPDKSYRFQDVTRECDGDSRVCIGVLDTLGAE